MLHQRIRVGARCPESRIPVHRTRSNQRVDDRSSNPVTNRDSRCKAEGTCIETSLDSGSEHRSKPLSAATPYRISPLIPKKEGAEEKGEFSNFTADLHPWMEALSNEGEGMPVRVDSSDRTDRQTLFSFFPPQN